MPSKLGTLSPKPVLLLPPVVITVTPMPGVVPPLLAVCHPVRPSAPSSKLPLFTIAADALVEDGQSRNQTGQNLQTHKFLQLKNVL